MAADSLLSTLVNYEQQGIPANAGSVSAAAGAFDLGRMHRLLAALGDPHLAWPAIHVAGSKGKLCSLLYCLVTRFQDSA